MTLSLFPSGACLSPEIRDRMDCIRGIFALPDNQMLWIRCRLLLMYKDPETTVSRTQIHSKPSPI